MNFRVGSQQRTHSDTIHFHCFPARFMCGVWLALEDVGADNGPLRYYPGSHKLPIFDLHDLGVTASRQKGLYEHYVEYEDFIEALIAARQLKPVEIDVRRGQALFWAANLLHGGSPIRDPSRTRHTQATHYYFDGCSYYTPLASDLALGRIEPRAVFDITDGRRVEPVYNGVPLSRLSLRVRSLLARVDKLLP